MINENQRCKMITLLKAFKKYHYNNCTYCTNGTNFSAFNKVTILHLWFLFIIYGF